MLFTRTCHVEKAKVVAPPTDDNRTYHTVSSLFGISKDLINQEDKQMALRKNSLINNKIFIAEDFTQELKRRPTFGRVLFKSDLSPIDV
uniref:Uncharacterized protein n=1 Tax=Romanomermis culicivorax TaxID=13658 RepID=A0A915KIM0_ROMCU